MPARIMVRRLTLHGLAALDHPSPADLERRLADAAREFLPDALGDAVSGWSGDAVLRIRQLRVDVTLDAAFQPRDFAALLARAIDQALRRAEMLGTLTGGDGLVRYPSRAVWLAALLEALAEGRAFDRWWLRDTEGLRFLPAASAIRTAALAEPKVGLEALATLPPMRRAAVLRVLTPIASERLLSGLAGVAAAEGSFDACLATIADSAAALPASPAALALFLEAAGRRPALVGPDLAITARLWAEAERILTETPDVSASDVASGTDVESVAGRVAARLARTWGPGAAPPDDKRGEAIEAVAAHLRRAAASGPRPEHRFTRFGGLLLLLPNLGWAEIDHCVSLWPDAPPDTARMVAHAVLGLCAGRVRFAAWLEDTAWRELFGLDVQAPVSAMMARLAAIQADRWDTLLPLGERPSRHRDARFLLPRRDQVGTRPAARALAGLARATTARFARRLAGFANTSAPFLWTNVLAMNAVLEQRAGGWHARLSRPPLDVLLSLSRIAEGSVATPSGTRVELARVTQ